MSSAFAAGDVGRGVACRIGSTLFWSRIASYISATSVSLAKHASLPASNGTIDDIMLLDLGETHSYQDYLDDIEAKIKDLVTDKGTKLTAEDRAKYLRSAVTNYGRDKAFQVKVSVTGNGTGLYSLATILGNNYIPGFTTVSEVEHPSGELPASMLESEAWEIYDDGSAQDGSNHKLRFIDHTPESSESFILSLALQLSLPEIGQQNFPDTNENFENITTLAAAFCCFALAAAYATSSDSTIGADTVNYNDKSRKYTELARNYLKRYNLSVFGEESPTSGVAAAFVDVDLDADDSQGGDYLNHPRRFR